MLTYRSGVSANHVSFNNITRLEEAVFVGGSLVITSAYMNLDIPRREKSTSISLMCLDPNFSNANDLESYDIILCLVIRSKSRVFECSSKQASHGFSLPTELQLTPWFQKDEPRIRVDVGTDELVVFVDERRVKAVERNIKRNNITHVRYWTSPQGKDPALAKDITVTTYKQTGLLG